MNDYTIENVQLSDGRCIKIGAQSTHVTSHKNYRTARK